MQLKSFCKKIIGFLLLFIILFTESETLHTAYAANLKFYNYSTNSNVNYTGKQVIYTYNSRELPLTYPGILIDGTALADYEELFVQELGLQVVRNEDTITFFNDETILVLTIGSKKVTKNGVTDTMSVAPVKLKFEDTVKYYVPTRYVAEAFGFGYVWVSSTNTVKITKTLHLTANEQNFTYNGTLYAVKNQEQRIFTDMPVIYYNGNVIAPAKQIFEAVGCTYREEENSVIITKNELSLTMDLNSKIAYINEKKIISNSIPMQITDHSTGNTQLYVSLEFVADLLGFTLTYSDSERRYTLEETVFTGSLELYPDLQNNIWNQNIGGNNAIAEEQQPKSIYYEWIAPETDSTEGKYLSKVVAYAVEGADVVELYGIARDDINDFFDSGMIVFELKSVHTDMDTQYFADFSTPHLNYTLLTALNTNIKLFFMIPQEDEWTFVEKEDCVQVYFAHADLSAEDLKLTSTDSSKFPDDKLVIPLPENVKISHISDEDNYLENNFNIIISGNYLDFYQQNYLINPYYYVENSDIYYDAEHNNTIISITTKSICGYKYTLENGFLSVTIGRPDEIFSKILVLDAGHGGIDPGATKSGIKEKDLNFTILNTYVKELFRNSDVKVYFTRDTDVKIDLYERAAFASEVGADMFISLHMNSNNSTSVNGTEVYYSVDNNETSESGFNSYQLAKALVNNLSLAMNTKNRGTLKAEFVVVKYNTVPAVLIELGYMTNATDFSKLTNVTYQVKAAETIYQTVISLFNAYLFR